MKHVIYAENLGMPAPSQSVIDNAEVVINFLTQDTFELIKHVHGYELGTYSADQFQEIVFYTG